MFEKKVKEVFEWTTKKSALVKEKCWSNEAVRLAIMFVIAALLLTAFTCHQFKRRNGAISAYSQRIYNQERKTTLDRIQQLKNKLHILSKFNRYTQIDDDFLREVKQSGIQNIQHQAQLLTNCTEQYIFDQYQRKECEKTYDQMMEKVNQAINVS